MPGLDCGDGRRCLRFLQPHLLAARDQRLALGPGEAGADGGDAGQPGVVFSLGKRWAMGNFDGRIMLYIIITVFFSLMKAYKLIFSRCDVHQPVFIGIMGIHMPVLRIPYNRDEWPCLDPGILTLANVGKFQGDGFMSGETSQKSLMMHCMSMSWPNSMNFRHSGARLSSFKTT